MPPARRYLLDLPSPPPPATAIAVKRPPDSQATLQQGLPPTVPEIFLDTPSLEMPDAAASAMAVEPAAGKRPCPSRDEDAPPWARGMIGQLAQLIDNSAKQTQGLQDLGVKVAALEIKTTGAANKAEAALRHVIDLEDRLPKMMEKAFDDRLERASTASAASGASRPWGPAAAPGAPSGGPRWPQPPPQRPAEQQGGQQLSPAIVLHGWPEGTKAGALVTDATQIVAGLPGGPFLDTEAFATLRRANFVLVRVKDVQQGWTIIRAVNAGNIAREGRQIRAKPTSSPEERQFAGRLGHMARLIREQRPLAEIELCFRSGKVYYGDAVVTVLNKNLQWNIAPAWAQKLPDVDHEHLTEIISRGPPPR